MPRQEFAAPDEPIDAFVRRVCGTERLGNTEAVVDFNPGLALLCPVLPAGHPVMIPDGLPRAAPAVAARRKTSLW